MWFWARRGDQYDHLKRAYEARLGRMTLAWNQMEAGLDLWVESLFWLYQAELAALSIVERPLSLDKKLQLVRKAHNGITELPDKAEGLRLANAIADIMDLRHKLTHGIVAHYLASGDVMLMNFRFRPGGPTFDTPVISHHAVNRLTKRAHTLFPQVVRHVQSFTPNLDDVARAWPQVAQESARRFRAAVRRLPASERPAL